MPEPPPKHDPIDEAFAAYLRSCDEGELRSREEFLSQFPDLADELRQLLDAADLLGQFSSGDTSSAVKHDAPSQANHDPNQETLAAEPIPDGVGQDAKVTLPLAHREEGDPGPRLPYELDDLYVLLDELGRGGMGVVYLAKQKDLDRYVAVKMIRSGLLAGRNEVKRFYTEAQSTARLHHPGIVSIYHFGRYQGHHYFSMEYVRGTDLQRRINQEILSPAQAARYVRDTARAIHHAHQRGVLHRDLKPANVLIDSQDQIHITDFGLAKHMDSDSSMTGSGAAVGTPHYMAPEQAGGHSDRACLQSDVYSLGAILFAAVTGRPPIAAETVMQTLVQVIHEPAPPLRSINAEIPIDLETIVAKCLEKQPEKRYATAEVLAGELDAYLEGQPIKARPRSRLMRAWNWVERVPLVAAVMGRRLVHTSAVHRRVQAAMLLVLLLIPIFAVTGYLYYQHYRNAMPDFVRVAGGIEGGVYNDISAALAERMASAHPIATDVIPTSGSLENRDRLLAGEFDLAPMQATAIRGDRVSVVAPLFYEVLYVLAQTDTNIQTLGDLKGHRVAIGPSGSGSQATADLVLDSLGLSGTVQRETVSWQRLFSHDPPDVAMVCIGRNSPLIEKLLKSGKWRMIPFTDALPALLQHPTLRFLTIDPGDLAASMATTEPVPTVGTTAFLAARSDSPAELVVAVLEALYAEPPIFADLIPRSHAAEWQGLVFHPAAREFFAKSAKDPTDQD